MEASQRIWKHVRRRGKQTTQYYLNCWKPVKPDKLQREDEISLSVNVAKAEKIIWIVQG